MYQPVCMIRRFNIGSQPNGWRNYARYKTDKNLLFLDTNMEAGHGGASGRFEALKEVAKEFSFLLDLEKIKI